MGLPLLPRELVVARQTGFTVCAVDLPAGKAHEAAPQPFVPQTWEPGCPPEEAGVGARDRGRGGDGV